MRRVRAWAGFVDGHMDLDLSDAKARTPDGYCVLYRTRREARRFYQDVRRVEIREVSSQCTSQGEKR